MARGKGKDVAAVGRERFSKTLIINWTRSTPTDKVLYRPAAGSGKSGSKKGGGVVKASHY